jgi:carotenoid 1,2-hydratase
LSDDGRHGLTVIAFIGSVFSPYYAWARQRGAAQAADHCALNIALYGGTQRWAMTERRRGSLRRDAASLAIGPSSLHWDGRALNVSVDEITAPLPSRIRGSVRLFPDALFERPRVLDDAGVHRWRPIAPVARVEVDLDRPGLRWSGAGYWDSNAGDAPLEDSFTGWDWSRAREQQSTTVFYDIRERNGRERLLATRFHADGRAEDLEAPPRVALQRTSWGIARAARSGGTARVLETLEDTPFYARSLIESRSLSAPATAMHESLSLERFRAPWVRLMLPFRMPRARR